MPDPLFPEQAIDPACELRLDIDRFELVTNSAAAGPQQPATRIEQGHHRVLLHLHAVDEIARWTKKTRDASFIDKDKNGYTVNRLETIGWIGGCTDTNELNFLAVKTMRSMGLCYFETQARV